MSEEDSNSRILRILLGITAILASLFFCIFQIEKSVWLDEANSILTALRTPAELIASLQRENNAPGYYFILHGWMGLFGSSPISVRLLSGLMYLLSIGFVYKLADLFFDNKRTALFSAIFFIISPIAVSQSQNIRMYALLGLLSAISFYLFIRSIPF